MLAMRGSITLMLVLSVGSLVLAAQQRNDPSETKIDVDAADMAAFQQKLAAAGAAKMNLKGPFGKSCEKDKKYLDHGGRLNCEHVAFDYRSDPKMQEQILLKGCSLPNNDGIDVAGACRSLVSLYEVQGRLLEALEVLKSPNYTDGAGHFVAVESAKRQYEIYFRLGNNKMQLSVLHDRCYDLDDLAACRALDFRGEKVDMGDATARARQTENEQAKERAQARADKAEEKAEKAERNQAIVGVVEGLADTAVSSYGDYQAGVAQARVNVAVAQMEQQNKARGGSGYPTTSSSSGGSSSTSSSSSTTSKKPAATTSDSTDTSNSTDASSDSSASSSTAAISDQPFNPYSSTGGGYNAYSALGVPPEGSTIPGESGHWVDTEMNVTCYSSTFPNTLINALLVNGPGEPNCNGAFVEFSNPDKTHPFYYGFAGVINERMEANSTRDIKWPAPYLYKDRPNPAFVARVSIRYFAAY